jgi:radical SAM superfamily enzyme YgiQ (UPF0313 family)
MQKPLTFPILASLTPEEHSIEVIEGEPGKINFDKKYDLVAITFVTPTAFAAYSIADEFRRRGSFVVLGGYHASALPNEAKQHADSVVICEAEEAWPQLIKDFKNKTTKSFYEARRPVDPKLIPHPLYIYKKKEPLGIQATRGCPYGCEFCAITNTKFGSKFRKRKVSDVIEDIKSLPSNYFSFHDNSLTIDPTYSKQLFKEMKKLNYRFSAFGNINVLSKDDEFLKLAREAGCDIWAIGFESISQETLNNMGKRTNLVKDYISGIKKVHDHGMLILGLFVFGFDNDTLQVFDKTDEFVRTSEIDVLNATILTPYPGTALFDRLEKEKRILTKDWNKYNSIFDVVFQPKNMTPGELLDNTQEIYSKWYGKSYMIKRMIRGLNFGPRAFVVSISANISRTLYYYAMDQ